MIINNVKEFCFNKSLKHIFNNTTLIIFCIFIFITFEFYISYYNDVLYKFDWDVIFSADIGKTFDRFYISDENSTIRTIKHHFSYIMILPITAIYKSVLGSPGLALVTLQLTLQSLTVTFMYKIPITIMQGAKQVKPKELFDLLRENNICCFSWLPDSLLKDFCAYITDYTDDRSHTITANEGNAVALAAGHYLATGNPALVYMQNSGLRNCINPLLSLTDEDVYNIPVLMLIGWRGEPGKKDEPRYVKQGKVTNKLLEAAGIKYRILPEDFEISKPLIEEALEYMRETKCPFVFIVKKGLAGKAVNISRTTASHALSYKITSEYGLPHGHTVALTIGRLFAANSKVSDIDWANSRRANFVKHRLEDIRNLLNREPSEYFPKILKSIGLEYDINVLNIKNIDKTVKLIDLQRLRNNPKKLEVKKLINLFYRGENE